MALTRSEILGKRKAYRVEEVECPGLGGTVFVRVMSAAERDRFEAEHAARRDKNTDFRARLVAAAACDESGAALFTAEDVPALGELPSDDVEPVVKAALRLNGLAADSAEDARKN